MACKNTFFKWGSFAPLMLLTVAALAQNELRETFFKNADAALAAADATNARLLSPKNYQDGMKDYEAAENGLERGRNIEYVRSKAAAATAHLEDAAKTAALAKTVLSQSIKSRQDAANARATELSREV
ncbi:MAG: hypothetical protein WD448_06500, partial [Woeseia sp.]